MHLSRWVMAFLLSEREEICPPTRTWRGLARGDLGRPNHWWRLAVFGVVLSAEQAQRAADHHMAASQESGGGHQVPRVAGEPVFESLDRSLGGLGRADLDGIFTPARQS